MLCDKNYCHKNILHNFAVVFPLQINKLQLLSVFKVQILHRWFHSHTQKSINRINLRYWLLQ